jgi:hypothetical protein
LAQLVAHELWILARGAQNWILCIGERDAGKLAEKREDAGRFRGRHMSPQSSIELVTALFGRVIVVNRGGAAQYLSEQRERRSTAHGIPARKEHLDPLGSGGDPIEELLPES